MARAIVIFQDDGQYWAAPFLMRGFRHCCLAVETCGHWVLVDPATGTPRITVLCEAEFDLVAIYRQNGMTAIATETVERKPIWPVAPANCVGVVKAVLGLRKPFILTPFQLFKHLTNGPLSAAREPTIPT